MSPEFIPAIQADPKLQLLQSPGMHIWWIALNMHEEPMKKKEVRQALNYAVNKDAIVNQILRGAAAITPGPDVAEQLWHAIRRSSHIRTIRRRPRICSRRPAIRTASRPSSGCPIRLRDDRAQGDRPGRPGQLSKTSASRPTSSPRSGPRTFTTGAAGPRQRRQALLRHGRDELELHAIRTRRSG